MGRRWGKTRWGASMGVACALSGGRAWWVAPSYQVAMVGWRLARSLSIQVPETQVWQGDRIIEFKSGGQLRIRSGDNPDSLRGDGLDLAILDECAFMNERVWSEGIRPALSDRKGKAILISTPNRRNWFHGLFTYAKTSGDKEWAAWQLPSSDNPYLDNAEIESARRSLPARIFEQEYLAHFLEGEGTIFRNIYANMTSDGRHSCTSPDVVAGVDWGKLNDYTVISIGCRNCHKELYLDRFNKIDYHFQRQRLEVAARKYNVRYILAESNSIGEPNIESLRRAGLPIEGFATTAQSKPRIIENLSLSLEKEEFQFIADEAGIAEMEAYEMTVTSSGRPSFSAPGGAGSHDDTIMARAIMLHSVTSYRPAVF